MTTFSSESGTASIAYCRSFGENVRDNNVAEGMDERKESKWKSLRKCDKLSINSTTADGKMDGAIKGKEGGGGE